MKEAIFARSAQPKTAKSDDYALATLTLIFGGVYIYLLATTDYACRFVMLYSSLAGAVFYRAAYFAPAFCADKLLGTGAKTPRSIALARYLTRIIALAFVVLLFVAFLAIAPIALISGGWSGAKSGLLSAAISGAFVGLALFTCAMIAFKKSGDK
ncbi:MAG: hypothetical protein LBO72_02835 [Helicobacteraceae bacterium]|jgi:hypothetical protein|nr:hypothetical protein [Helicobacteraceae bacterium]